MFSKLSNLNYSQIHKFNFRSKLIKIINTFVDIRSVWSNEVSES